MIKFNIYYFVRNQTDEVEPMAADETETDSRHQDFQGDHINNSVES